MIFNKLKDFTVTPNQFNLSFKYAWLTLIICALVILAVGEFGPSHKIRQPSPQYFGNTPPQNRQG